MYMPWDPRYSVYNYRDYMHVVATENIREKLLALRTGRTLPSTVYNLLTFFKCTFCVPPKFCLAGWRDSHYVLSRLLHASWISDLLTSSDIQCTLYPYTQVCNYVTHSHSDGTTSHNQSQPVTASQSQSQPVTTSHNQSQPVITSHTDMDVLSMTVSTDGITSHTGMALHCFLLSGILS